MCYEERDQIAVRKEYLAKVKSRFRDMIYRANQSQSKPKWMPVSCFEILKKRKDDPKFQEVSAKAKANRCTGGSDGKAPPTHVLGRKSATRALDTLVSIIPFMPYI